VPTAAQHAGKQSSSDPQAFEAHCDELPRVTVVYLPEAWRLAVINCGVG
jgi:hypothetical protein